jgi:hypothetical protein
MLTKLNQSIPTPILPAPSALPRLKRGFFFFTGDPTINPLILQQQNKFQKHDQYVNASTSFQLQKHMN